MLVEYMKKHQSAVQAACLGVMQNLSSNGIFHQQLLDHGALDALDSSKGVKGGMLGIQCATILYNFSLREQSLGPMIQRGGIFLVTHLSFSDVIKVRNTDVISL